ncbi:hypothetical protein CLCR_07461 [Cladophialophora carrionii]|uniref:F-box domain-containing protein n=1 Tax=Cladophialophora carrionii TaxID=86049 RepID=A0A1C1CNU0_9EURO|nr:hypothetical protein CLCR_07461 [Cladophialophora carrionii]
MTDGLTMLQELHHDILTHIVSFLDAPSAVCLALTCHQNYESILSICRRSQLEDICPRDVGKPLPKIIDAQSYNTLALDTAGESKPPNEIPDRWMIDNFQFAEIPDTVLHHNGYRPDERPMMAKHLAYIRHVEWHHKAEGDAQPSHQAQLSVVQGIYPRAQISFDTSLSRSYLRTTSDFSRRFEDVAREFILMLDLWNQQCIESMDFMTLRERLGDNWIKTKTISVLRLKQRKMRRERALRRFIQLASNFHAPAPRRAGKLRRIVRKVSREFGYHGHAYSGLIWIEERIRSILHQ